MADSKSFVGGKPVAMISASCVSRQLSFMMVGNPVGPCSSRSGSASGSGTPILAKEGPIPRTITRFGTRPEMMKGLIMTLSPVPSNAREERFAKFAGVALGVGVGVGVGVAIGVGVGVAGSANR